MTLLNVRKPRRLRDVSLHFRNWMLMPSSCPCSVGFTVVQEAVISEGGDDDVVSTNERYLQP